MIIDNIVTEIQKHIIQLLRLALTDKAEAGIDFSHIDWMPLMEELFNQTVLGTVWGGIENNPTLASQLPLDAKLEFYGQTRKLVARNEEVNKAVSDIVSTLNEAGINSILLKGQGCASFYPTPLYRSPGDIDLLVGKDNFYKAQECLKNAGLVGDWIHEDMVHGMLSCHGVTLELHKFAAILPSSNDKAFQEAVLPCLAEKYQECPRISINDTEVALLPIELNTVFTFLHMFRHFVGYGILFRQVCDWLQMTRRITETMDVKSSAKKTEQYLKDFGFLNTWKIFTQMAVECMGIPAENVLLYEKNYSNNAPKVLDILLQHDIKEFNIGDGKSIKSIFNLLLFYKAYLRHFRIFPKECIKLLLALMKINIQKNILKKL